jgi:hypothetical protein
MNQRKPVWVFSAFKAARASGREWQSAPSASRRTRKLASFAQFRCTAQARVSNRRRIAVYCLQVGLQFILWLLAALALLTAAFGFPAAISWLQFSLAASQPDLLAVPVLEGSLFQRPPPVTLLSR